MCSIHDQSGRLVYTEEMTAQRKSDKPEASTTWAYRKIRVRATPTEGGRVSRPEGPTTSLSYREPRRPLWIEIRYVGGLECSWLVAYRGRVRRFPGHMALHDVLTAVNGARLDLHEGR